MESEAGRLLFFWRSATYRLTAAFLGLFRHHHQKNESNMDESLKHFTIANAAISSLSSGLYLKYFPLFDLSAFVAANKALTVATVDSVTSLTRQEKSQTQQPETLKVN